MATKDLGRYEQLLRPLGLSNLPARSVIASALLGSGSRGLRVSMLIRLTSLFGIAEGAARVALSRMVAAGELESVDGRYRLAGRMLERQSRQDASRWPRTRAWDGSWSMAVLHPGTRSQATRDDITNALAALRLARLREGVWLRPDNLAAPPASALAVVEQHCERFDSRPAGDQVQLAARLWDLAGWEDRAHTLRRAMVAICDDLEREVLAALAPGFMVSTAVFRHVLADPILPFELLPGTWPGEGLRSEFERHDAAWQSLLRAWVHGDAHDLATTPGL